MFSDNVINIYIYMYPSYESYITNIYMYVSNNTFFQFPLKKMNEMINNFYNKYMNITLKKIKFIDINIIFNLFNIILLSIYAFTFSLFKEKIANATIFTAIGNLTLLIALRVQVIIIQKIYT